MAVKGIDFDLGLDTTKADKKFDEWCEKIKSKASQIDVKLRTVLSGGGAGGGKSPEDQAKAEQEKLEKQAARHAQRLADLAEKTKADIIRIETLKGASQMEARKTAMDKISRIETDFQSQSISKARNYAAQLKAEYTKAVSIDLSQITPGGGGGAGGKGKWGGGGMTDPKNLQYVFQTQQLIEDFSYAGMRGASNNIALMASMLGGPAGLIALIGVMGLTLAPTIVKMLDFGKGAEEAADRLSKLKTGLTGIIDLQYELHQLQNTDVNDMGKMTGLLETYISKQKELREVQFKGKEIGGIDNKIKELMDMQTNASGVTGGWANAIAELQSGVNPMAWPIVDSAKKAVTEINAAKEEINKAFQEMGRAAPFTDMKDDSVFETSLGVAIRDLPKVKELYKEIGDERQKFADKEQDILRLTEQIKLKVNESVKAATENPASSAKDDIKLQSGDFKDTLEVRLKAQESLAEQLRTMRDMKLISEEEYQTQLRSVMQTEKELEMMKEMEKISKEHKGQTEKEEKEKQDKAQDELKARLRRGIEDEREKLAVMKQQTNELESQIQKQQNEMQQTQVKELKSADKSIMDTYKATSSGIESVIKKQLEMKKNMIDQQAWHPKMKGMANMMKDQLDMEAEFTTWKLQNQLADKTALSQMKTGETRGKAGDFEGGRNALEDAASIVQDRLAESKTPEEAAYWAKANEQIQGKIADLYKEQKDVQAAKLKQDQEELEIKKKQMEEQGVLIDNLRTQLEGIRPAQLVADGELEKLQQAIIGTSMLVQMQMMAGGVTGMGGGAASVAFPGPTGVAGARADGGPVDRMKPYLIGEEGPEIFVPNRSGQIISTKDLTSIYGRLMPNSPITASPVMNSQTSQINSTTSNVNIAKVNISSGSQQINVAKLAKQLRRESSSQALRRG